MCAVCNVLYVRLFYEKHYIILNFQNLSNNHVSAGTVQTV
jgi:hypothetical protein